MRIVVTGASGFLGPKLISALARGGHCGTATSRRPVVGLPAEWKWSERKDALRDESGTSDAVIHLEVKQHVFSTDPETWKAFESVNILGTKEWLDWCDRHGVERFVYFSSVKAVIPAAAGATDEWAPGPNPSLYGTSKWRAEDLVRAWAAADPGRSALILRPAVIYGPGNTANIAAMVEGIRRGRFFLVGKNANIKSVVSVGNVAAATRYLIERMQPGNCEVFCMTDAQSYSVRELDAMIRTKLGKGGNSPTIPPALARLVARGGDLFERISGHSFPLNSHRLAALLEQTHFTCAKLKAAGFVHPQSTEDGLAQMNWWCDTEAGLSVSASGRSSDRSRHFGHLP